MTAATPKPSQQSGQGRQKPRSTEQAQAFAIQRIYVKDASFEAPNTPGVFKAEQWQPEVNMELNTHANDLKDGNHEVVLSITLTAKAHNKVAFLVEIQQAGIFTITDFPQEQLKHALGSFCPATLYPYAREAITTMIVRGGFPQLYLAPINFDALYQEQQKRGSAESAQNAANSETTTD